MRIGLRLASLAASFGFMTNMAAAQEAGNPDIGEEIANDQCARCHDVSPEGAFKTYPPSFASIAYYRSAEQIRARIVFPPLHSSMPEIGWMLSPFEVDDMVAFIQSLEPNLVPAE